MEKQLNQEISNISTNVYEGAPAELGQIQESADKKALIEQQEADKKGGWATFIVLAVLFVFIQILGILFGHKWGFAGKESAKAYRFIKGYDTPQAYEKAYEDKKRYIANKANDKLSDLQAKMSEYINKIGIDKNEQETVKLAKDRNFDTYIIMQLEAKRYRIQSENDLNKSLESTKAPTKTDPSEQNIQAIEPKQPATSVDLKEVQERVDELSDLIELIEAQRSKGGTIDMAKLEKYKAELNKNLEILIDQTKAEIADKLDRNESFDELNEKLKEQLSMLKAED